MPIKKMFVCRECLPDKVLIIKRKLFFVYRAVYYSAVFITFGRKIWLIIWSKKRVQCMMVAL